MRRSVWIMYRIVTIPAFLLVALVGPAWVWVKIGGALFPETGVQTQDLLIALPMVLTYAASLKWLFPLVEKADNRVRDALLEPTRQD